MERYPTGRNQAEKVPQTLSDVSPIEEGGVSVLNRADISRVVELPLVDACTELYDKNIETWQSSANQKDIEIGEVYIVLVYSSLSNENKAIARQFSEPYEYNGTELIKLSLPITKNSTIEEIKSKMHEMVEKFQSQPMTWASSLSLEEASQVYGVDPETLKNVEGWYYDEKNNRLYQSKEHYEKTTSSKLWI